MENLIETIEKFLAYSDEKLEGGANEKIIRSDANTIFLDFSFCC
ncbi:MAG: recombinase [Streptococcus gallolyticus]|uniref:Recombinase n=1 Tax=Streptococcus gallolyticus TaxID=315405 RepID=A0A927XLV1_9STRE|nr:recombinase [Streptococcus gallolyticus]